MTIVDDGAGADSAGADTGSRELTELSALDRAKRRIVNRNVNPLLMDLPEKFVSFRPQQVEAVFKVVESFDNGSQYEFLDAPTGTGKTVMAEVIRRELGLRGLYMCTTKSLQDQFVGDFPYARVLKGRSNYPTERFPHRFHPNDYMDHLSCEDCTWTKAKMQCKWCEGKRSCPYEFAKRDALKADLAVLNTAYFLAEANSAGRFSDVNDTRGGLVIVDEADTLEAALMSHVSVEISERQIEKWGLQPPERVTVVASWKDWLDETLPKLQQHYSFYPEVMEDVRMLREARGLGKLIGQLQEVRDGIDDGYWKYTGRAREDNLRAVRGRQKQGISFKPSRVDKLGWEYFWQHGTRVLCMSASPISCQEIADSTGLTGHGEFHVVKLDSPFPVANRQVKYKPVADMAKKNQVNSWPLLNLAVMDILDRHPDDRILVHTVSYSLTEHLRDYLRGKTARDVASYENAQGRLTALARFKQHEKGVCLAPSMDRGIDLPGDLCRVQVIVKCPFPFLDVVTSARLHSPGGQQWYTIQTIRAIVQMCGRAVRGPDDYAVTYILDSQFEGNVWSRGRNLFPQWFADAIDWRSERVR